MSNNYHDEDDEELEGEDPPEALDNLTDELIMYAKAHDEEVSIEWDPEGMFYEIFSDDLDPVEVYVMDIDDALYGEAEAITVEAVIGHYYKELDLAALLRECDTFLVYAHPTITRGEDKDAELVLLQAACPIGQMSVEMFDAMIREVATISADLHDHFFAAEDDEEEDEEEEDEE
ncbi:MAG: hypothetical protein Q4F00_00345 [bacterium]|nr:hypothetical protein [bacterium]